MAQANAQIEKPTYEELVARLDVANQEVMAWRKKINHHNMSKAKVGAIYTNYDDTRRMVERAKSV